jgi:hypothetical protein
MIIFKSGNEFKSGKFNIFGNGNITSVKFNSGYGYVSGYRNKAG